MKTLWGILKKTGQAWIDHEAPSMGSAVAYYTVLSMAPLAVIAIAIAGSIFGDAAARGQLVYEMQIWRRSPSTGSSGRQVVQRRRVNELQETSSRLPYGKVAAIY